MNRAEKELEVSALEGKLKNAAIAICTDYRGLTVAQITSLRKKLNEKGVRGKVVKNTLARIAVNNSFKEEATSAEGKAHLDKFLDSLIGPSFVIFADQDAVAPAKVACDFAKENEKLQIKGAWFEGKFVDKAGVQEISSMPSREEVLAKLLALLNTPATQLLRLIKEPSAQVARVLGAFKDKLEKGS